MSSDNIGGATQTLARLISNGIRDDSELQKLLHSEELISLQAPSSQEKPAQVSILLYSVTECTSMRNLPQNPRQPRMLLYLNLSYLITPVSKSAQMDQLLLGKIIQILAEKPILRGSDLQGSLEGSGDELKVVLDSMSIDDLSKVWTMLSLPYKPSISYSIYPVPIKSEAKPTATIISKQPFDESKKGKSA